MTPLASMSPLLFIHIVSASLALLSGAAVFAMRKGTSLHRQVGNVFFVSMLIMSALGAYLAELKHIDSSVMAGIFTFYLVATGWMTIRRRPGTIGAFEIGACVVGLGIAAFDLGMGWKTLDRPSDGVPYLIFGAVAAIASVSDLKMIRQRGLSGGKRIARHLWRMGMAMFIATASLFLGQQKVLPAAVHGSPILFVPVFLVLGLTIYWLIRTRFAGGFRSRIIANQPSA